MFKRTALSLFATLFLSPAFAADITIATAAGYRKPLLKQPLSLIFRVYLMRKYKKLRSPIEKMLFTVKPQLNALLIIS